MIGISVQTDTSVLTFIQNSATNSPKLMQTALRRTLNGQKRRILARLQTEPGPPQYPIRWKSARQRRAFFATNGFGRGIPTTRTHELVNAYDLFLESTDAGGVITITNSAPEAPYVIDEQQQPYHADTGWPTLLDTALIEGPIVEAALIETWITVSDPFAGIQR